MAEVGQISFDINSLTIDEMELIEDVAGASFEDIMTGKAEVRGTKILRAFAFMALRRENPDATLQEAGKISVLGLDKMLGSPLDSPEAAPVESESSGISPKRRASRSKT